MPPLPTDPMPQPPSLPPGAPSMLPTTPPPVRQEGRGRASLLQLLQQQPTPTQSTSPGAPIPMEVTPSRPHPPSMGATPPSATSISKKDVLPSEARQGSQGTRSVQVSVCLLRCHFTCLLRCHFTCLLQCHFTCLLRCHFTCLLM